MSTATPFNDEIKLETGWYISIHQEQKSKYGWEAFYLEVTPSGKSIKFIDWFHIDTHRNTYLEDYYVYGTDVVDRYNYKYDIKNIRVKQKLFEVAHEPGEDEKLPYNTVDYFGKEIVFCGKNLSSSINYYHQHKPFAPFYIPKPSGVEKWNEPYQWLQHRDNPYGVFKPALREFDFYSNSGTGLVRCETQEEKDSQISHISSMRDC